MEAGLPSDSPATLVEASEYGFQGLASLDAHSSKHFSNASNQSNLGSLPDMTEPAIIAKIPTCVEQEMEDCVSGEDVPDGEERRRNEVHIQKINHEAIDTNSMVTISLSDSREPAMAKKIRSALMVRTDIPTDSLAQIAGTSKALTHSNTSSSELSSRVRFNDLVTSQDTQNQQIPVESEDIITHLLPSTPICQSAHRRDSMASISSAESTHVDWVKLDKNEELEPKDEASDESTAFLLARLEQENHALATDPKAGISDSIRTRSRSRPPSIQQLRKLVSAPSTPHLRYSLVPHPPPMTELEFWSALVSDYPQTAQRLPTLTSNKIRGGIPPPLRGVVWMSIAGARDSFLEDEYERLCGESSPYENLIGKDIGRSYPGVDMFRDADGEGQKMLGKVLNAFSLWDQEIGYCQGLGFVVGPLLMHMGDEDAFCVLVRLMEHYDLRSCFLPDLSGLHLRIFQFQHLLSEHLPELSAHLDTLRIEPLYLSQWFLSFFGVTCPLPMLLRIYDVILTEGASETLMRVALSLMRRNEKKILAATELEDIMHLLLSRMLWDTYGGNADELVQDFCGLNGLVTREGLQGLESRFKLIQQEGLLSPILSRSNIHSAASRFLGKFWAGTASSPKLASSPALSAPRSTSSIHRTPSKQSMASTLNSLEGSDSTSTSNSTEVSNMSRQPSADWALPKTNFSHSVVHKVAANKDRDLHSQIEDLLTALSDMQRVQTSLESDLQREREERDEDRAVVQGVLAKVRQTTIDSARLDESQRCSDGAVVQNAIDGFAKLEDRFSSSLALPSSADSQTKQQLHQNAAYWKEQHAEETARSTLLAHQVTEGEHANAQLKDQLREIRQRVQDSHRDKQRLEQAVKDLRGRRASLLESPRAAGFIGGGTIEAASSPSGLREFRLNRSRDSTASWSTTSSVASLSQVQSQATPLASSFGKRASSLQTAMPPTSLPLPTTSSVPASVPAEETARAETEAILLELVTAKTSEAVARQELEEVKGKLDSLRRLLSKGSQSGSTGTSGQTTTTTTTLPPTKASIGDAVLASGGFVTAPMAAARHKVQTSVTGQMASQLASQMHAHTANAAAGFFSGWGKRAVGVAST